MTVGGRRGDDGVHGAPVDREGQGILVQVTGDDGQGDGLSDDGHDSAGHVDDRCFGLAARGDDEAERLCEDPCGIAVAIVASDDRDRVVATVVGTRRKADDAAHVPDRRRSIGQEGREPR